MNRAVLWAAIALPALGLGGLWALTDYQSRQGTEWDVPIQGYDPRDLLRGHYVEFTYDWPLVREESDERDLAPWERVPIERLCLSGEAPVIETAVRIENDAEAAQCTDLAVANPYGVYSYDGLNRGRLYAGQDRALEIQEEMRDPDKRGIVRIRVREDGTVTPLAIRFRPLSAEEIAERDTPEIEDETASEE
ncbi:GDYXXLXY domain-containing protein [Erythrobacter sp. GH1-10]|uniref:GDYXXLXY domain-containing protein n=1 Tax=Erythrobacter sp. GH1-10 TaxID=3349334 RepID=UPI003877C23E